MEFDVVGSGVVEELQPVTTATVARAKSMLSFIASKIQWFSGENSSMNIDLETGRWVGEGVSYGLKHVSDLTAYFKSEPGPDQRDTLVYETFGLAESERPDAQMATTVLKPGLIGDEFFMTRGHFHVNPERGETCVTLAGKGILVLGNREGNWKTEEMAKGSVHVIDGLWAHRVVNVGDEPLVFLVTWVSDCGHDYASIEAEGFPVRVVSSSTVGHRIEVK